MGGVMEHLIAKLGWIIVSYLIGSFPFGLLIAKINHNIDPRLHGSKNTGATNIARTCGTRFGVITFILDMAKGYIPMLIALTISPSFLFLTLAGLAIIIGHMHSIFLQHKGGKGVATSIGIFAALAPGPLFLALILCLIFIWTSGYISLGSLCLMTSLPIFVFLSGDFSVLILALIIMAMVISKHRENIVRLARGHEIPWQNKTSAETQTIPGS